jgi:hypothetical protein
MKSSLRVSVLLVTVLPMAGGCVADSPGSGEDEAAPERGSVGSPHLMLTDEARQSLPDPAVERRRGGGGGRSLTYYGGPIVQTIDVHPVFYNSNVQYQSNLNAFYGAIVTGAEMTFLSQYRTSSPSQSIGNGTAHTAYVDSQTATSLTDAQVQAHLTALFDSGALPKPNSNTYYPIHYPSGVSITSGFDRSCVQFCAYHGTYVYDGQDVYYGVLPDLSQSGCNGGCGGSTVLNNTTAVASHEFAETVTDPAVGLAIVYGPPLAWYNATYGEIGDICNGQQTTAMLGDGSTYTVQKLWSNSANSCVTP